MFINQILTKLKSLVYSKSETDSLLNGKASSSHTHTKSQISDFPTIPSKVSQLTNDSGFITGVSWDSVSGKPSAFTPSSHTHTKSQITDFPSLATVATSGSYSDLSNKPSIPTNTNQLTNGAGFITSSGSCNYANSAGYASSAGSAGEVNTSVADGSAKDLVYATMASNDAFRIQCGGSGDGGWVEIATSDNGNEPIYVRQYNWDGITPTNFSFIVRTLTLLDEYGNTTFPGTVTAPTFSGNLNGNCSGTAGSVAWGNVSGRPTKVSQFTNDSGFITSADRLPIGSYIQFAGSQAPAGFLVCNGGAISRTTYSALFAVIGTTYGSGDGSTTFNLPNLTDRFLQGSSTSGTVKDAGLPNITGGAYLITTHTGYDTVHYCNGAFSTSREYITGYGDARDLLTEASQAHYSSPIWLDASRSNSIYGNSSTVQPPALTCLICIKY